MKKNILYFTRTMGLGGTEKVILQLCENLTENFNNIVICSMGGVHEEQLRKLGIKHYKIADIENKSLRNMYLTIKTLNTIIKRENIDIIHSHHRMAAFYVKILSYFKRFKFVHTAHNTFSDNKILTKWSLGSSNIIAVGERVSDNLNKQYHIKKNKIKIIYNGVERDNNKIDEIEIFNKYRKKGYFLIGNIGRLNKQKGMKYYINAIPRILQQNSNIIFFIVGEGEERKELEELVFKLGVKENVIFMGYRNDINNIIKQLDLIILSSLWEGLPLIPLEVFSNSKTIVATDVDGTSEIVKNMENGILVCSKSSEAISEAIITLYNDRELMNKLEKNAVKTYKEKFTIKKMQREYRDFYNQI